MYFTEDTTLYNQGGKGDAINNWILFITGKKCYPLIHHTRVIWYLSTYANPHNGETISLVYKPPFSIHFNKGLTKEFCQPLFMWKSWVFHEVKTFLSFPPNLSVNTPTWVVNFPFPPNLLFQVLETVSAFSNQNALHFQIMEHSHCVNLSHLLLKWVSIISLSCSRQFRQLIKYMLWKEVLLSACPECLSATGIHKDETERKRYLSPLSPHKA